MNLKMEDKRSFFSHIAKLDPSGEDIHIVEGLLKSGMGLDFLKTPKWKGLIPLIYKNLKRIDKDLIPSKVLEDLASKNYAFNLRTAVIYDDLKKLIANFNSRKVSCLLLQGAAIADILYKDVFLRPMDDVDMFVRKDDWPKIKDSLVELGYKTDYDAYDVESFSPINFSQHVPYVNSRGTIVEFKFNVFYLSYPGRDEAVWDMAVGKNIFGMSASMLSPEYNLLYLASHMNRHGFTRLIWFTDLYEMVKLYRGRLDWTSVIKKAREKRLDAILYFTLIYLDGLFPNTIDKRWLYELRPAYIRRRIHNAVWNTETACSLDSGVARTRLHNELLLAFFTGKMSFADLLRHILKALFPKKEYIIYKQRLRNVPSSSWKYYLIRLYERLISNISSLTKALRHS